MRKILIDSHILLWWLSKSHKLERKHFNIMRDQSITVITSIASLWELHIKAGKNQLEIPENMAHEVEKNHISILQIRQKHLTTLLNLPYHHRDPFDRLMISQAISENIPIISYDNSFSGYPVELL